ncbi:hypothetical protein DL768_002367 [Monosporascus sp. mg162]|nr:hypothetical protein DL768_002367 [Monosporascus sp. mg162]
MPRFEESTQPAFDSTPKTKLPHRHASNISTDTTVSHGYNQGTKFTRESLRHTNSGSLQLAPEIWFSLYISIFLVALDRTILGPAIQAITNQFKSIDDIGWCGSAYMLTACGFILLYGRVYTFFPTKPVFLSGIVLSEAGSAACGAASSSLALIIGRAIQGLRSSGIFTGAILIMTRTVPLHRRPMLQGLFGACFGLASVIGPLLGGIFTGSRVT